MFRLAWGLGLEFVESGCVRTRWESVLSSSERPSGRMAGVGFSNAGPLSTLRGGLSLSHIVSLVLSQGAALFAHRSGGGFVFETLVIVPPWV